MNLAHLQRLWQPRRPLFWQMVTCNVMSSVCAWALRTLPLTTVGVVLVGTVGLLNVGFGLAAAWALLREPPPGRAGNAPAATAAPGATSATGASTDR